jgi:mono/diheme cytochrome c family protein
MWLVATAILAASACQPRDNSPAAASGTALSTATPDAVQRGQSLYKANCKWCHGDNGSGIVPLQDAVPTLDDAALSEIIANGQPGKGMPAHVSLTAEDIVDLVAFVRSWQQ